MPHVAAVIVLFFFFSLFSRHAIHFACCLFAISLFFFLPLTDAFADFFDFAYFAFALTRSHDAAFSPIFSRRRHFIDIFFFDDLDRYE